MRDHQGKRMFSATDLMNYVGCSHSTWLDLKCGGERPPKGAVDEEMELLFEKGIAHEQKFRDSFIARGLSVTSVSDNLPLEERVSKTIEAMERGDAVIYQAALIRNEWHGFIDFLRRVEQSSKLGIYSYEVIDTKLGHTAQPKYLIQLCIYSALVECVQGSLPANVYLVLGTSMGDMEPEAFRLTDFNKYVALSIERFATFVSAPPANSLPEPCAHCDQCHWKQQCEAQWKATDHLCAIAGIQRSQILKLNEVGIHTVQQLLDSSADINVHIGAQTLIRLRAQAGLQKHKELTNGDKVELIPQLEPHRGFGRLPKPNEGDLFFDMEGDPHYPNGLEYLFGFTYLQSGKQVFRPFWAHSHEEEKATFQAVMDFVIDWMNHHPQAYIYHYNHYEPTALKRLANGYGTRDRELDVLLRGQKFVDLYKVVREGIRTSEPSYSLKNIEKFYLAPRLGPLTTAGDSVVNYERWLKTRQQSILDNIAAYNEQDCVSTLKLRDWLLTLRPSDATWFEKEAQKLDANKEEGVRAREEERAALVSRLRNCTDQARPGRELICQLLDFHWRAKKPEYWQMFQRRDDYTDDDFIRDAECLGPLTLVKYAPQDKVKQSTVFTYEFPEQDTKFEVGDKCLVASTLDPAGEFIDIDYKSRHVRIKRGNKIGALPQKWSAIPTKPISDHMLASALLRFAEAEAFNSGSFSAASAILGRTLPRIQGLVAGADIPSTTLSEIINSVSRLEDSYLLIQGPPGAGKTFTASHIIVALLREGKRVGVSSNSHKAIHNLLYEVESLAQTNDVPINGVKKASTQNIKESRYESKNFETVTNNDQVTAKYNLVAGTVYLYSELKDQLDFLFVDEAGQVSLANLVVMAMATKNIVLIGDQMQLSQPIQGSHPGESGMSGLDYLLQGRPTIPAGRGIFLSTTYRMHDDVCRFISEAVYEGKLHPDPDNQLQTIVLSPDADPAIKSTGIQFIEINHEGCSQRSSAEGARIKELYQSLLLQMYTDRKGARHPLEQNNILVISPYNLQVNYLRSILPPGARVGTVDKFQGQQAEVVLISMTTSSGEDLPRDFEFLYSRNRLNVAISRARALSCVIASPRLLEVPCSTVEQMKLVNTLCWVRQYSQSQNANISNS